MLEENLVVKDIKIPDYRLIKCCFRKRLFWPLKIQFHQIRLNYMNNLNLTLFSKTKSVEITNFGDSKKNRKL